MSIEMTDIADDKSDNPLGTSAGRSKKAQALENEGIRPPGLGGILFDIRHVINKKAFFCSDKLIYPIKHPESYDEVTGTRFYDLPHFWQRLFVTLEVTDSCLLAKIVWFLVMVIIIVNIADNIMMTLPQYRRYPVDSCNDPVCVDVSGVCANESICEPTVEPWLVTLDKVCVIIFTIEYGTRLLLCPTVPNRVAGLVHYRWDHEESLLAEYEERDPESDPEQMPFYKAIWIYFWLPKNVIDVISIIPFYVTLIIQHVKPDSDASHSLSFIRILRLLRILRGLAKGGKGNFGVFRMLMEVVKQSWAVLSLILVVMGVFIFIFGSIIFDSEQGSYVYNSDYPGGAYVRTLADGSVEESPFVSTFSGMYWAIITMTTVGYGDLYPLTTEGRLIASLCAFIGVLFMALPIAILGSKVTIEYNLLEEKMKAEENAATRRSIRNSVMRKKGSNNTLGRDQMFEKAVRNAFNAGESESSNNNDRVLTTESIALLERSDSNFTHSASMSTKEQAREEEKKKLEAMTGNILRDISTSEDKSRKREQLQQLHSNLSNMYGEVMVDFTHQMERCKIILNASQSLLEVASTLEGMIEETNDNDNDNDDDDS